MIDEPATGCQGAIGRADRRMIDRPSDHPELPARQDLSLIAQRRAKRPISIENFRTLIAQGQVLDEPITRGSYELTVGVGAQLFFEVVTNPTIHPSRPFFVYGRSRFVLF